MKRDQKIPWSLVLAIALLAPAAGLMAADEPPPPPTNESPSGYHSGGKR